MFVYGASWLWSVTTFDVLLCFLCVTILVRIIQIYKESVSLPPGPWGVPIFGCLPYLRGDLHTYFNDVSKMYGGTACTKLGIQRIVVMSDYKSIRDAFRKEEFTGRPTNEFTSILGGYGVINTEGKLWKDQRRFLQQKLRNLGMTYIGSKSSQMETRIMREVDDFVNVLKSKNNEPIDLNPTLAVSISNVICDILMSVRFTHDDKKFKRYMTLVDEGFKLFGSISSILFFPLLKYWPCTYRTRDKIVKNREEMGIFLQEAIDEHRKIFDSENRRDLVDEYLYEIYKAQKEGTEDLLFEGKDHDRQIQQILGDMFSAGMETIKSTLLWSIVFMLRHPDIMRYCQEEMDEVVGRHRMPKLEDIDYLPFTEATILEVMRRSSVVPMGTTHSPTRATTFGPYKIPANTQIIPLLHAVHMDPTLWVEPEKFNPIRFIDEEGCVRKPEYFLPFGVGRRMCLGAVLARMEIFLFFAGILHAFHIIQPEGEPVPSAEGSVGITINPLPFTVCFKARAMEWDCTSSTIRSAGSH